MYKIQYTSHMKRDVRLMRKRGKDLSKLVAVLNALASGDSVPEQLKDHPLSGRYKNFRECHIEPDWLLIYQIYEDTLILSATATGTHADLFGM